MVRWDLSHELDVLFCGGNRLCLSLVCLIAVLLLLSLIEGEIMTAIIVREIQRLLIPHRLSIVLLVLNMIRAYDPILLRYFERTLVRSFLTIRVVF